MKRNFNIAEILESVDSIIYDNKYNLYKRRKIINASKKINKKKIDMKDNSDNEKIILDAEDSLKGDNPIEADRINKIKNKMERIEAETNLILKRQKKEESVETDNNQKIKAKVGNKSLVLDNEETLTLDHEEPLILKKEYTSEKLEVENNLQELEDINTLKELENNFVYINEKLKLENIQKEEKIKDLDILVNKFVSQERYSDLDKKIKMYQDDNALLRKKVLKLSDHESALRLQLIDLDLDRKIEPDQNEKLQQPAEVERQDIKELNIKTDNLLQKHNQLETELSKLKKAREIQPIDVDKKIQFYREENAKIIVDKNNIEKKLENTKNQLSINENNKQKVKIALDNLSKILGESNIDSTAFINKIEEQTANTNKTVDENTTKLFKK